MRLKRLTLFLSLVLIMAFVLAACSSNNEENATSTPPANNGGSNDNEAGQEEREHLELKWFVSAGHVDQSAVLPSADQDFVKQAIEEKFNVTLNMESSLYTTDNETQLTMRLASDPPHVFVAGGHASQSFALDGLLADMTPFISPETMPNYFNNWVSGEELERYAIENSFVRAPLPFGRNRYQAYYIRKDWLDNLGLDIPTNYDEMMDVMRAFTFDDPDDNGRNDTFGMTAAGNGQTFSWQFPQLFNHNLFSMHLDLEAGTYRDGGTDLALTQIMNEIKDMLDEGIVDPDWFLQQGAEAWDSFAMGKAGIIMDGGKEFALEGIPNSVYSRLKGIIPEAEVVPFNPFPDVGLVLSALPGNPFMFHVEVAEEEPEAIERTVEILDWLAGEEGYLLTHYGQEGVHYTREGNVVELIPDAYSEIATWLSLYSFFAPYDELDKVGLDPLRDPRYTERDIEIIEEIMSYKVKDHIGTNVSPPPGSDLGALRTKMREFQAQILFDEPDASNWPEYRDVLMTDYGGQELFEFYAEQIGNAHGVEITYDPGNIEE